MQTQKTKSINQLTDLYIYSDSKALKTTTIAVARILSLFIEDDSSSGLVSIAMARPTSSA